MREENKDRKDKLPKQIAGRRTSKITPETEVFCPNCGNDVELVFVHGHYQCPVCKGIIVSCCEGEAGKL